MPLGIKLIFPLLLMCLHSFQVNGLAHQCFSQKTTDWFTPQKTLFRQSVKSVELAEQVEIELVEEVISTKDLPPIFEATTFCGWKGPIRLHKRKKLVPSEVKEFATLWKQQHEASPVGCFYPHHIIRVGKGEKSLFDLLICFHCSNFSICIDGKTESGTLDLNRPEGKKLQKFVESQVGTIKIESQ